MAVFHTADPGSTPGTGTSFLFKLFLNLFFCPFYQTFAFENFLFNNDLFGIVTVSQW